MSNPGGESDATGARGYGAVGGSFGINMPGLSETTAQLGKLTGALNNLQQTMNKIQSSSAGFTTAVNNITKSLNSASSTSSGTTGGGIWWWRPVAEPVRVHRQPGAQHRHVPGQLHPEPGAEQPQRGQRCRRAVGSAVLRLQHQPAVNARHPVQANGWGHGRQPPGPAQPDEDRSPGRRHGYDWRNLWHRRHQPPCCWLPGVGPPGAVDEPGPGRGLRSLGRSAASWPTLVRRSRERSSPAGLSP